MPHFYFTLVGYSSAINVPVALQARRIGYYRPGYVVSLDEMGQQVLRPVDVSDEKPEDTGFVVAAKATGAILMGRFLPCGVVGFNRVTPRAKRRL